MGRLGLLVLVLCACRSNPGQPVDARELDGPIAVDATLDASGGRLSIAVAGRGVVLIGDRVCADTCELDLPLPVSIAARAAEAWQFDGFSAPCGSSSTCTPPLDASIVATFSRAPITANLAFITSSAPQMSSGGVAALDAYCQSTAAAAGHSGMYVAFVATSTSTITQRLAGARGWVRVDGLPVLDQVSDLGPSLPRPILFDETGAPVRHEMILTGIAGPAAKVPGYTCLDWTSSAAQGQGGASDHSGRFVYAMWVHDCLQRIACVGVDRSVPVELYPAPYPYGRYIFSSTTKFTPGGGVAAADAICQGDANAAGLPGAFRAALATSSTSAAGRFASIAGTWRRPDGIVVTHDGLDQLPLLSTINVEANGTVIDMGFEFGDTFLGASSLTAIGASTSCGDWTATTGTTEVARLDSVYLYEVVDGIGSCASAARLLCAEI